MRVELIDSTDRFADLEREWRDLVAASAVESPFLTWEWLFAWWTHLRESRRLAIVTVRDRERLVAIAPFCTPRNRVPFFHRWEFLGTGCAGSDYLDAIVRDGFEIDAMRALSEYTRNRNLALHLEHLAPDSWLSKLPARLADRGWSFRSASNGVCPFIQLDGHTWDSFLGTIGPANRATTRRRFRSLERTFALRFERVTDDRARQAAMTRLFEFHDARFGRKGTAFHSRQLRAFHLDATDRLTASQLLRLYTLHLNDDLVAVMYGMSFKRRFFFYQHGYDPRYRPYGLGRALLDMSIRAAIEEGLSEFDLLYGSETYKASWTTNRRTLTRIDLFPPHLGGRIHQHAVETERTLRAFARRVVSGHVPQTN